MLNGLLLVCSPKSNTPTSNLQFRCIPCNLSSDSQGLFTLYIIGGVDSEFLLIHDVVVSLLGLSCICQLHLDIDITLFIYEYVLSLKDANGFC